MGGERVPPGTSTLTRTCVRPGCSAPAAATLAFFYGEREVCLERLGLDELPATYDLCATHADRMRPPHGWVLNDRRTGPKPSEASSRGGAQPQQESTSVTGTSQPSPDPSRSSGWLGFAVEATVAFYAPGIEELDDSSPTADADSQEARAADHAEGQFGRLDPEPDSDEVGLDSGPEEVRLGDPGPDEVRLVDPAPHEGSAQEDFVPVRAKTW